MPTPRGKSKNAIVSAPFSRRLLSSVFDFSICLLLLVVSLVPSLIAFLVWANGPTTANTVALFVFLFIGGSLFFAVSFLYLVLVPYLKGGSSLGQAFLGTKVVAKNGGKASFSALLARAYLPLVLSVLTIGLYYVVELFILLSSERKESFLDAASSTRVVAIEAYTRR